MSFSDIVGSWTKTAAAASTMTGDIRAVLSPLLTISFIFGTRITEFPAGQLKPWYSSLYIVLLWSTYYTLLGCTFINYIQSTSFLYQLCFWMNTSTALLSFLIGTYYNKKFRSCLRKLVIIDDTLKKLGTIIDYHKLHTKVLWIIIGWLVFCLWITYSTAAWHCQFPCSITKSLYTAFMLEYCTYVNLLDDLVITSVLGYIELKYKQINEHLRMMENDTESTIKKAWEESENHSRATTYPKSTSNECDTWIVIHLHLELRKISRELNSIFGLQMTVKMSTYFTLIAQGFYELFNVVMIKNYNHKGILYLILVITYVILVIFRLFIINYMCEKVSNKANLTKNVISKILYSTNDVGVRENISQFLLQMSLVQLKFYGLGLYQFGFTFLRKFCFSVTTVIVILVQSHSNDWKIQK